MNPDEIKARLQDVNLPYGDDSERMKYAASHAWLARWFVEECRQNNSVTMLMIIDGGWSQIHLTPELLADAPLEVLGGMALRDLIRSLAFSALEIDREVPQWMVDATGIDLDRMREQVKKRRSGRRKAKA